MTVVEYIQQEFLKKLTDENYNISFDEIIEKAKAMEKEQIMNAVDRGYDEGCKHPEDITLKNAEQYYNETYKNK